MENRLIREEAEEKARLAVEDHAKSGHRELVALAVAHLVAAAQIHREPREERVERREMIRLVAARVLTWHVVGRTCTEPPAAVLVDSCARTLERVLDGRARRQCRRDITEPSRATIRQCITTVVLYEHSTVLYRM